MIIFKNYSSKGVKVSIDNKLLGVIQQGESVSYNQPIEESVSLILSHTEESFVKRKRAHMLIESTYKFLPVEGRSIQLEERK